MRTTSFVGIAFAIALMIAPSGSVFPEEPPAPADTPAAPPAPEAAPEQPPIESPWIVRVYDVRPARLFKGLLESLEGLGFPPEETDEAQRTVKSSFVDFKQDDYEYQVAEPPQAIGAGYHVLQMIKVRGGKVSLQGIVAPAKGGAELRMRARILVMGLDRAKRVRVLVDRKSTGMIEADFVQKLETRLGIRHQ